MGLSTLNNVTTGDNYSDAATLQCPGAQRIRVEVANAAVYVQPSFVTGVKPMADPPAEELFLAPGVHPLTRPTSWVRVRSALAGSPAQVTIYAYG